MSEDQEYSPLDDQPPSLKLRTFISPLLRPKTLEHVLLSDGRQVHWLDDLFAGGVVIPGRVLVDEDREQHQENALLWLVTGPPGTGKTTLTLQICRNIASQPQDWLETIERVSPDPVPGPIHNLRKSLQRHGFFSDDGYKIHTLFVSLETPATRLLENMSRLGWDMSHVRILNPNRKAPLRVPQSAQMMVVGSEYTTNPNAVEPSALIQQLMDSWDQTWQGSGIQPGIVVIDSLNTLPESVDSVKVIEELIQVFRERAWIIIVLNEARTTEAERWEYAADIITRLDVVEQKDYLLGTFRIVKAKNQEHAQGTHRVKIYSNPEGKVSGMASGRSAPTVREGGFYVFPSVHRLLSATEALPPMGSIPSERNYPFPIPAMDVLLGDEGSQNRRGVEEGQWRPGLPTNGCTVFTGKRGLLKSYLSYYWLLYHLRDPELRGILFSMRDDEEGALATLDSINSREGVNVDLAALRRDRRLQVVHFRPGYMPPEEFMHRVLSRLGENTRIAVVNGIDHIPARLPLCAALDVFVPALATLMNRHNTTTIFNATDEHPGRGGSLGLLPMADFILRFADPDPTPEVETLEGADQRSIVIAERVPAGGIGGLRGCLYRDHRSRRLEFMEFGLGSSRECGGEAAAP